MPPPIDFLAELEWRGLLHQATDKEGLRQHLADPANHPRSGYAGFDPTSDSLTIGNLVPIMLLVHFARAGHKPVVVMGGGTGLIGDPSGKSAERELMSEERVRGNVEAQRSIFGRVFANADLLSPVIVNNLDWLGKLGYLEVLRDVGKYFSVNGMIQRDSIRERLTQREQGISYTEFSYMLLQAYDFYHLYARWHKAGLTDKVDLQVGGSDQWGNIVAGTDFIRRSMPEIYQRAYLHWAQAEACKEQGDNQGETDSRARAFDLMHFASTPNPEIPEVLEGSSETSHWQAFGLTAPLVTKSDGTKFGKTESGAIWLSPHRTSPYAYYQFWLNAADDDAAKWLRIFTLLTRERVEAIDAEQKDNPGARPTQRALARGATSLLHGEAEMLRAEAAAAALFSGDIASLPLATLNEVLAAAPSSQHDKGLLGGEGMPLVDLIAQTSLATSKSQARQYLTEGSVSINGKKAAMGDKITAAHLLHGSVIALRRGKKTWHVTRWE